MNDRHMMTIWNDFLKSITPRGNSILILVGCVLIVALCLHADTQSHVQNAISPLMPPNAMLVTIVWLVEIPQAEWFGTGSLVTSKILQVTPVPYHNRKSSRSAWKLECVESWHAGLRFAAMRRCGWEMGFVAHLPRCATNIVISLPPSFCHLTFKWCGRVPEHAGITRLFLF